MLPGLPRSPAMPPRQAVPPTARRQPRWASMASSAGAWTSPPTPPASVPAGWSRCGLPAPLTWPTCPCCACPARGRRLRGLSSRWTPSGRPDEMSRHPRRRAAAWQAPYHHERGQVTAFVLTFVAALILMAGAGVGRRAGAGRQAPRRQRGRSRRPRWRPAGQYRHLSLVRAICARSGPRPRRRCRLPRRHRRPRHRQCERGPGRGHRSDHPADVDPRRRGYRQSDRHRSWRGSRRAWRPAGAAMSPPSVMGRLLGGLGRLLWGLGALLVLLALVGGVPAVLWLYLGWPLPHALPTLAEFGRVLTQNGIPDTVLINILVLGCWAAWAVFAASIVVETPAAVRGRTARRIPMAGPLQALASSLVAAVLLTFAPVTHRAHAEALPGAPLPAALAVVEPTALVQPKLGTSRPVLPEPPPATHRPATKAAPAPAMPRRYTVKPRDTLWGIADRELGDPFRWHDIYRRNKDRPQPDGGVLTDPDLIRPGWTLELPASTASSQPGAGGPPSPTLPPSAPPAQVPDTQKQPEQPSTTTTRETTSPSGTSIPAPQEGSRPHPPGQPAGPARPAVELPSGAVVGLSLAGAIAV